MTYSIIIHPKCKKEIIKACRKNPVLERVVKRKMREIIHIPSRYKPMRYELKGERRVHILKSFVLKFEINEAREAVIFLAFEHHDRAYKR